MATVAGGEGFFLPLFSNVTDFSTANPITSNQSAVNLSLFNNGINNQTIDQYSAIISTGAIQAVGGMPAFPVGN
jgi:hypothetical protein